MIASHVTRHRALALVLAAALLAAPPLSWGGDFSVSPIRAELKPGSLSETISVTNHSDKPMRVGVRLLSWTQDSEGKDVLTESGDLIYFPRQMDIEPGARRLVRIGAKNPAGPVERAYRLFIEEVPPAGAATQPGMQVAVYFRFGLPIFLPPAVPRQQPEFADSVVRKGELQFQIRNPGNQHFRLTKVQVSDGAGFSVNVGGWYTLAGASRTYTAQIPAEVCQKSRKLIVLAEGDGVRLEREVDLSLANCT